MADSVARTYEIAFFSGDDRYALALDLEKLAGILLPFTHIELSDRITESHPA